MDLVKAIARIDELEAAVVQMRKSGYTEVIHGAKQLNQELNLRLEMTRLIAPQRHPDDVAAFTV